MNRSLKSQIPANNSAKVTVIFRMTIVSVCIYSSKREDVCRIINNFTFHFRTFESASCIIESFSVSENWSRMCVVRLIELGNVYCGYYRLKMVR